MSTTTLPSRTQPTRRSYEPTERKSFARTPLSPTQLKILGSIRSQAIRAHRKSGLLETPEGYSDTLANNQWAHAEQARVFGDGRTSLKHATQADYRPLLAHWNLLAGKAGPAFDAAMYSEPDDENRRQIRHHLDVELRAQALSPAYAAAIAKNRFGTREISRLSDKQLIQLLATVRNRGKAKAKKAAAPAAQI